MQPDTLLITAFNGFLMAGLTALVWTRSNRFEDRLDRHDARFDQMGQLLAQCATKADVSEVRSEVVELRGEVNSLRSDLTHIALVVGAHQPRSADG